MDGRVSTSAIRVLIQNLIDVLEEENYPLRVGRDALNLQMTLGMIEPYLNYAEKFIIQEAAILWLRELEAVAFNAENVLDELNYYLHKNVNKTKTPYPIDKVLSCFSSFSHRRKMSHTIKQINADFEAINKRATDLGLPYLFFKAPDHDPQSIVENAPAHVSSDQTDPIFIGRDDDVSKLVYTLTHLPENRSFFIVALVGMGGMGKTTLTRKVFNDERVKNQFGVLIWVHVSQTFDPFRLLIRILLNLTERTTSDGVNSINDILENLQEALKYKTYLLVLDDVWNEDFPMWEKFINSIAKVTSSKGNGIIITTRSHNVASIVDPFELQILYDLSDDDCWSIIKARAFDRNGEVPLEYETIGRKMAKSCLGLPRAASILGNVLYCRSEVEWRFISINWLLVVENSNITGVLRMIYNTLSLPSLKECLAYCSVFPEGQDIPKQELIELWMAEGFLQPNRREDMESVGNMFVNELLEKSLLQVAEKDDHGNILSFVMHELVHCFASSVLSNNSDDSTQIRHMFLKEESCPIPKERAKHLRILECENSDIMFSDFKSLRILTLSGDHYKELPNSVMELIMLRKLDISNTRIGHLPEWIDNFHYLQTLRVCKSPLMRPKLPSTLKYLLELRHLYTTWNTELPADIGRLTRLRTLRHFRVGKDKGYRIEELGSLQHLKGKLEISNLEKVHDKEEALKANIYQKSNLSELVLKWETGREGEENDEAVLEGLLPHLNETLNKLMISGFQGKRFPTWTQKIHGLQSLKLYHCYELECVPNMLFRNTHSLSELDIRHCPMLRELSDGLHGMAELSEQEIEHANDVKVFPGLKSLRMYHCYKLDSLPDCLFRNTHSLSVLDIRHCPMLRELPGGLQDLDSLEQMTIRGCRNLKSIMYPSGGGSSIPLPRLHSLEIRDCQELVKMVEPLAPLLEKACLVGLKSLENLPKFLDCLAESPLLKELTVVVVPELASPTPSVKNWPFTSLKKLEIDVSRQWSEENNEAIKARVDGILKNCNSSLSELALTGRELWKCLPESLQHLTALNSLELANFGVEELPEYVGKLSSLRRLSLSNCTNLTGLPSMQRLTELKELRIAHCPKLRIEYERQKFSSRTIIFINGHQL